MAYTGKTNMAKGEWGGQLLTLADKGGTFMCVKNADLKKTDFFFLNKHNRGHNPTIHKA